LYEAWVGGSGGDRARTLADRVPVPVTVALRGRFHLLTDPKTPEPSSAEFQISWVT
jgi:hypothetical protein